MSVDLKIDLDERSNGGDGTEEGVLATIDFSDWHFWDGDDEASKIMEKLICATVSEAMRNTLRGFPPQILFDGTGVMVSVNLGSSWNDGWIHFVASIEEMTDDLIVRSHRNEMYGGDDAKTELADCLFRCASKLKLAARAK